MPETYVVHLGNSNDLMKVAEDSVARMVLREHVRESLGVRKEDLIFAVINSMFFLFSVLAFDFKDIFSIWLTYFQPNIMFLHELLFYVCLAKFDKIFIF